MKFVYRQCSLKYVNDLYFVFTDFFPNSFKT